MPACRPLPEPWSTCRKSLARHHPRAHPHIPVIGAIAHAFSIRLHRSHRHNSNSHQTQTEKGSVSEISLVQMRAAVCASVCPHRHSCPAKGKQGIYQRSIPDHNRCSLHIKRGTYIYLLGKMIVLHCGGPNLICLLGLLTEHMMHGVDSFKDRDVYSFKDRPMLHGVYSFKDSDARSMLHGVYYFKKTGIAGQCCTGIAGQCYMVSTTSKTGLAGQCYMVSTTSKTGLAGQCYMVSTTSKTGMQDRALRIRPGRYACQVLFTCTKRHTDLVRPKHKHAPAGRQDEKHPETPPLCAFKQSTVEECVSGAVVVQCGANLNRSGVLRKECSPPPHARAHTHTHPTIFPH